MEVAQGNLRANSLPIPRRKNSGFFYKSDTGADRNGSAPTGPFRGAGGEERELGLRAIITTGRGASLELLEGKVLPSVAALADQ